VYDEPSDSYPYYVVFRYEGTDAGKAVYRVVGYDTEMLIVSPAEGGTVEEGDYTTVLTAPPSGMIKIIGLDAGIYPLHEIYAPPGFNALQEPVPITITHDSVLRSGMLMAEGEPDAGNLGAYSFAVNGERAMDNMVLVENNSGGMLPEAGGIGRAPYIMLGLLLLTTTTLALLIKKSAATGDA